MRNKWGLLMEFEKYLKSLSICLVCPKYLFQPVKDVRDMLYSSFYDYGIEVDSIEIDNFEALKDFKSAAKYYRKACKDWGK